MSAALAMETIQVSPLSDVLAAEVTALDLSRTISQALAAVLEAAFLEHQVLCLRDQRLTPARFSGAHGRPASKIQL